MGLISVKSITKEFFVPVPAAKGLKNSLSSFFNPKFSKKVALNQVSFEIEEGEMLGYIGPNGAGKSTTVKILSGILLPTSGEVRVMGKDPSLNRLETVKHLGVVFGQRTQLWWDLPVRESFELLKDIYQVPDSSYVKTLSKLIDCLDLSSFLKTPVRQLSLGQRMRCDIAAALIHQPKILFLDEPTIGLDAVSKLAVRDIIQVLNKEMKVTVILTTHDMDDIETLCKRVLVLNEGEIYVDGHLNDLREKISPERYLIVDLVDKNQVIRPESFLNSIEKKEAHRVVLSFNPKVISAPELISYISTHYPILDLYVENSSIEALIAKLYREKNKGRPLS